MRVTFTYKNKPFDVKLNVRTNISRAEIDAYIALANIDLDDISNIEVKITSNRERMKLERNSDLLELLHELTETPVARMSPGSSRIVYSL